jgi:hypothetical protein
MRRLLRCSNASRRALVSTSMALLRRTRCRDNICGDPGRGPPLSNALMWSSREGTTTLRVLDSTYYASCPADIDRQTLAAALIAGRKRSASQSVSCSAQAYGLRLGSTTVQRKRGARFGVSPCARPTYAPGRARAWSASPLHGADAKRARAIQPGWATSPASCALRHPSAARLVVSAWRPIIPGA